MATGAHHVPPWSLLERATPAAAEKTGVGQILLS
jgi:hypothetical protein